MNKECNVCNNRVVAKKIRELFEEGCIKFGLKGDDLYFEKMHNCKRYKNDLVDGYKIVYKSLNVVAAFYWQKKNRVEIGKVWEWVCGEVNKIDEGWVYKRYGNSEYYGISKEFRG